MEETVRFDSQGLTLEGLMSKTPGDKGVVVTHPHPLYGGSMNNDVVEWIVSAFQSKGYNTLRFNFRGVGSSQGEYDNGVGEQHDVLSAISFLRGNGVMAIDLAGYSFGSWINANVVSNGAMAGRLIMVSPPVGFIDFESIAALSPLTLVITGSIDDIAPVNRIKEKMAVWNKDARLEVIQGADHFYSGFGEAFAAILSSAV